jgi:hypothetical protein
MRCFFSILALLFGFFVPMPASAQDCGCQYQSYKFKAYFYNAHEQADSAVQCFRQAFSGGHAALNDLLMACDLAIRIDSLALARVFMLKAVDQGFSPDNYRQFVERSGRGKLDADTWIPEEALMQGYARYRNRLDTVLLKELKRLQADDQRFRTGEDSPEQDRLRAARDSANMVDLRKMVQSLDRLPDYSEVGFEGADILELLALHMGPEDLKWYLPHAIRQIRRCEYFNTDGLAYQIDRIAVSSGQALFVDEAGNLLSDTTMPVFMYGIFYSVTGYWYDISPSDGVNYFWPVFEPMLNGKLQTTRRMLCLDTLEQYRQRTPYIKSAPAGELKKMFGG